MVKMTSRGLDSVVVPFRLGRIWYNIVQLIQIWYSSVQWIRVWHNFVQRIRIWYNVAQLIRTKSDGSRGTLPHKYSALLVTIVKIFLFEA
jgi:hypothetical protein